MTPQAGYEGWLRMCNGDVSMGHSMGPSLVDLTMRPVPPSSGTGITYGKLTFFTVWVALLVNCLLDFCK